MMLFMLASGIVASGTSFTCTPIAVWDGDGPVWCAEGPKIRLTGIAAREIDENCRPGQPCPKSSGVAARDYLVSLLGGSMGRWADGHVKVSGVTLTCTSRGWAKGSRTAANCETGEGVNLSCAMVRSGYALPWASYGGNTVCSRRVGG